MEAKADRQSPLVDCAEKSSPSVDISALSLSAIPIIMQISVMEGQNGPSGSLMNSKLAISICGALAKNAWNTVRTRTSLSSAVLRTPFRLETRQCVSYPLFYTRAFEDVELEF